MHGLFNGHIILKGEEMSREFISLSVFDKHWSEMGLTDENRAELEKSIIRNPTIGKVIQGTGGVRKAIYPTKKRNY